MKKIKFLILFVALTACVPVHYVSVNRASEVVNQMSEMPQYDEDHTVFWNYVKKTNTTLNNHLNTKSKFIKNNARDFDAYSYLIDFSRKDAVKASNEFNQKYLTGIEKLNGKIFLAKDMKLNAYVTPKGEIFISQDIVSKFPEAVPGVLAHEYAHYILKHAQVGYCENKLVERKARKKANLIAGLAAASAIAGGIAISNNTYTRAGEPSAFDQLGKSAYELAAASQNALNENATLYGFSYSRDQELEADIIACAYLVWQGLKPYSYIGFLQYLSKINKNTQISMYDTHPSLAYREQNLMHIFSKYID